MSLCRTWRSVTVKAIALVMTAQMKAPVDSTKMRS
jgi:hypothetical protein